MTPSEARGEIRHLQSRYNNSGDRGRIEDVIATFTADGVLEVPGASHEGREAISAFLSDVAETGSDSIDLRGSRHHVTTTRIEIEDDGHALGWTYFFVMRAGQVIQEGTYIDRYVLTPDGWLIARRRVKVLWTAGGA